MKTANKIDLNTSYTLVSTTDTVLARLLNKNISINRIVRGRLAHYEITAEHTVIVYVGYEMYELKGL